MRYFAIKSIKHRQLYPCMYLGDQSGSMCVIFSTSAHNLASMATIAHEGKKVFIRKTEASTSNADSAQCSVTSSSVEIEQSAVAQVFPVARTISDIIDEFDGHKKSILITVEESPAMLNVTFFRRRTRELLWPYPEVFKTYFPNHFTYEDINKRAFEIPFMYEREIMEPLLRHIGHRCDQWSAMNASSEGACYTALFGGRGEGKTRALLQLPSCGVSILYVNCREYLSASYPKRTSGFAQFFETANLQVADVLAFFLAYSKSQRDWIHRHPHESLVFLAESWNFKVMHDGCFRDKILSDTAETVKSSVFELARDLEEVMTELKQLRENSLRIASPIAGALPAYSASCGIQEAFIFDHTSEGAHENWTVISEALVHLPRDGKVIALLVPWMFTYTNMYQTSRGMSPICFRPILGWPELINNPGGFKGPFRGTASMYAKLLCGETPEDLLNYLDNIVFESIDGGACLQSPLDARLDFYAGSLFGSNAPVGRALPRMYCRFVFGSVLGQHHVCLDSFSLNFSICPTYALVATSLVLNDYSHAFFLDRWQQLLASNHHRIWPQSIFICMILMALQTIRVGQCESFEIYLQSLKRIRVNIAAVKLSDLLNLICEGCAALPGMFSRLDVYESKLVCFGREESSNLTWDHVVRSAQGGYGYFTQDKAYDIVFGVNRGESIRAVFVKMAYTPKGRNIDACKYFSDIQRVAESISPEGFEHIAILVEVGLGAIGRIVETSSSERQIRCRIQRPSFTSVLHPVIRSVVAECIKSERLMTLDDSAIRRSFQK